MSIRLRVALAGIAVAGVVLLAIVLVTPREAPRATAQATLAWRDCGAPFQCATLQVPLDYATPGSRLITLALERQPARDPSRRIGSLLVNPGGPGASGVEFGRAISVAFSAEIQQRFDIVGFDPRGVGGSTALVCHDNIQALAAAEPEPVTPAQWAEVERVTRDFDALCAQRGGDLLPHLGSLDVARDMDRIREALGDDRLTYVGFSYGTLLGELYADRFPSHVRAIVLDGAIDPATSADEVTAMQAIGFERAIDGFDANCRARSCALTDGSSEPWAAVAQIVAQARTHPLRTTADRPAGPGEVLLGAFQALYRPQAWRALERAVTEARGGDGTTFVRLADGYLGRQGNDYSNEAEMNAAVNCLDYAFARDVAHYRMLADEVERIAPRIGRSMGSSGIACALWPVPAQPIMLTGSTGAPPLLIVGTTNDPATPFEWALGARRALPSAVLLTHEGDGHTVYLSGDRCVDDIVDRYLLTLATPEDGAICGSGSSTPRTPPTPPARGPVATPALAAVRAPAGAATAAAAATGTAPAALASVATGTPAAPASPVAASTATRDRTAEGAIALRLLAVVVLALIIAAIVVTRRRQMRF